MVKQKVTSKEGYRIEDRGYSSPCWIWTGCITFNGYGEYYIVRKKRIYAHRYYYIKYKGPIPEGLEIDHLCKIRSCVNPAHLEAVSSSLNNKRSWKGRRQIDRLIQRKEV